MYFFLKIIFMFRDVPACSGMFRNVPCSGFYRRPFPSALETLGRYWIKNWEKVAIRGKASWFQITRDIGMLSTLQVCSIFYLAKNTNSTLGVFCYHLFSVIYAFFIFCCMFCENFWKGHKNIPITHSGYSRSYFNLFLIYTVAWDARKCKPSQI